LLSFFSDSIRKRNKIAEEKREAQIQALMNDPDELQDTMLQILFRNGVITRQILMAFIMSVLYALSPTPVNYLFGLVFIAGASLSINAMNKNSNIRSIYAESRRRLKNKEKKTE